jgi:hypothetical protein
MKKQNKPRGEAIRAYKIAPLDIRVVKWGGTLFFYRDRFLIEELDSHGKPTGILNARGLVCSEPNHWEPRPFSFRTSEAQPVPFSASDENALRYIIAGILIGEKYTRWNIKGKRITLTDGRMLDRDVTLSVWNSWFQWVNGNKETTFARFHLKKSTLRFGEDEFIAKILQRLGLPFS